MSEPKYFTLVFEGDIRDFKGNPLKTKTPFGVPVSSGIGNAFDEIEQLHQQIASLTRDDIEEPRP